MVLAALLLCSAPLNAREKYTVAAASSLQFALQEIAEAYQKQSGRPPPRMVYGSSGNLYRQISQGAPFDLFFSARGELIDQLYHNGISQNQGDAFGIGRLGLLSSEKMPAGKPAVVIQSGVLAANARLAIANPAHAPYGRAAEEALTNIGLWGELQANIINGEQVSQAAQYVVNGAVPFGLVSLSLALSPMLAAKTEYVLVDESLHEPIEIRMLTLDPENEAAHEFYNFVLQDKSVTEILKRYGLR